MGSEMCIRDSDSIECVIYCDLSFTHIRNSSSLVTENDGEGETHCLAVYHILVVLTIEVVAGLTICIVLNSRDLTKKYCRECKPASKIDCRGVVHIVRVLWGFR